MDCMDLMSEKLPENIYQLLERIGDIGDKLGCPVFVVGGIVRDLLLMRDNLDFDIVVEEDGIEFAHDLAETEGGKVRRHRQFGTAVVTLPDGFKVDVATARTEIYAHPGALPTVKASSIKDDLQRRDFSINAMAIDLNKFCFGELVDFFGGRDDLKHGYVRVLHDLSFIDDPTRIFRAIKFEQRYLFDMDDHTEELLEKSVANGDIETISKQRLRNEILLILKEENPAIILQRMADFNLLKYIHPRIVISDELVETYDELRRLIQWWETTSERSKPDIALLNLMALLDQLDADETREVSERLILLKKHVEALELSKTYVPDILQNLDGNKVPSSRIYSILNGLPIEVLFFAIAKYPKTCDNIMCYLRQLRRIKALIDGNDLHELSYPTGPLYTEILDKVFAAQLDEQIKNRDQAIQFIKSQFPL